MNNEPVAWKAYEEVHFSDKYILRWIREDDEYVNKITKEMMEDLKSVVRQQQAEIEALKAKLAVAPKPKRTRKANEEEAILLGAICRGSRAWLGWSQKELADKIGKSLSVIIKIEQGKGNPQIDTYTKLMSAFENNGVKISQTDKILTFNMQGITKK